MLSPSTFGLVRSLSAPLAMLSAASCACMQKANVHHHNEANNLMRYIGVKRSNTAKANRNTHTNERKFRKLRGRKTILITLPEDSEQQKMSAMSPMELRIAMLKKGLNPYKDMDPRVWSEHQITFQSLGQVLDPFVVPEDPLPIISPYDVKGSVMAKGSEVKQRVMNRWHNFKNGTRRIRKKEGFENFDPKEFGTTADTIYAEAHEALMARDEPRLHKCITEHAFLKMWPDVEKGSVVWELVERVEPSKVISIRCMDYPMKSGNDVAQLTVRMHTVQKLAIFDRFGHLILGSETEARPVVEYVVFENHVASYDGLWRLHDKVYPNWAQPKQPIRPTKLLEDESGRKMLSEAGKS